MKLNWWKRSIARSILLIALTTSSGLVLAQPASKPERPPNLVEQIAEQLGSPDPAVRAAAYAEAKSLLDAHAAGQTKIPVNTKWVLNLMKFKQFPEAADFARRGILMRPELSAGVSRLQGYRVKSLLAANQPQVALIEAKSLYNVCTMKDTEQAIRLVAEALKAAHPDDPDIANRFIAEQVALSTVPTGDAPATQPAGETILKSIKIDDADYKQLIKQMDDSTFDGLVAKGNLLLLADRVAEAKDYFKQAGERAVGEKETVAAIENMARAIRAETGSIGRANAYIAEKQAE